MVALSRSQQGEQPRNRHRAGTPLATMSAAALLVSVLVLGGCGRTSTPVGNSRPHATVTVTVTPTSALLPAASLSWTAGRLPPGDAVFSGHNQYTDLSSLAIAPSDGDTAYSCTQPQSAVVGPQVWVTHDRAQHWAQLTALPPLAQRVDFCLLLPDAADSAMLAVTVSSVPLKDLAGMPPQLYISHVTTFVTVDGGARWQLFHGPQPSVLDWLATAHGTTLALLETGDESTHLWGSTDQLQTWHVLPQAPYGQAGQVGQPLSTPLINPATGDLLVLGTTSNNQGYIYESSDLGQHWTSPPMPSEFSPAPSLVSPPVAGQPWRVCGIAGVVSLSPFSAGTLMCSMDSGRTWTSRPQLITTFDNTDKGLVVPQAAEVAAVGADGTIYAAMPSSMWPMGIPAGLYQLTPQATRWQPLTFPPGDAVDTTAIPGSGILWAVPGDPVPGLAGPFPAATV